MADGGGGSFDLNFPVVAGFATRGTGGFFIFDAGGFFINDEEDVEGFDFDEEDVEGFDFDEEDVEGFDFDEEDVEGFDFDEDLKLLVISVNDSPPSLPPDGVTGANNFFEVVDRLEVEAVTSAFSLNADSNSTIRSSWLKETCCCTFISPSSRSTRTCSISSWILFLSPK